jgi:hypothetical protein
MKKHKLSAPFLSVTYHVADQTFVIASGEASFSCFRPVSVVDVMANQQSSDFL